MAELHHIRRRQVLPITVQEAWAFFSTPANLARITPKSMGFVMRSPLPLGPLQAGQRITYTIRPVLRMPLTWVTLIEEVDEPRSFVDLQWKGPYALWRHRHSFTSLPEGTLMEDQVEYALPLGPLGQLAHRAFVRRQLQDIFDHRQTVLERLFPHRP